MGCEGGSFVLTEHRDKERNNRRIPFSPGHRPT